MIWNILNLTLDNVAIVFQITKDSTTDAVEQYLNRLYIYLIRDGLLKQTSKILEKY